MVTGTGSKGQAGILRIDFPGYGGRGTLEPISWEEFFAKFEESNLALVYSAHAHGHRSNFNKLIARESVDLETGEKVGAKAATPRRSTRSTSPALGERRAPRSTAARTASKTTERSSRRAGARQDPARRGPSRGTRSRSR